MAVVRIWLYRRLVPLSRFLLTTIWETKNRQYPLPLPYYWLCSDPDLICFKERPDKVALKKRLQWAAKSVSPITFWPARVYQPQLCEENVVFLLKGGEEPCNDNL
jgi:hypothetical protein